MCTKCRGVHKIHIWLYNYMKKERYEQTQDIEIVVTEKNANEIIHID